QQAVLVVEVLPVPSQADVQRDLVQDAPAVLDEAADDHRLALDGEDSVPRGSIDVREVAEPARLLDPERVPRRDGPRTEVEVPGTAAVSLQMVVVGEAPLDTGLDHVVTERGDQIGDGRLPLIRIQQLALEEVVPTVQGPGGLALRRAVTAAARLAHARWDLILEVEHVADVERRERRFSCTLYKFVNVVETIPDTWRPLIDLVVPAEPHVEEQPLVEEAAVQLPAHVIGTVVGEVMVRVEGLQSESTEREWSAALKHAGHPDRVRRVAATGGRRSGHGDAHPVIGIDEIGQFADELDRLLVSEPSLLAVGDERVRLVPVSIRLAWVLDVELPFVRVTGEARLDAGEEPKSVLDDVATERRSEITDVVQVTSPGDDRARRGHRLGPTLQRAGSERSPHAAVELVAPGLGDAAHGASGPAPVLGHVAAGDDVDLVEELDGQRRPEDPVGGVVHREAVDEIRVLR